MKIPFLDLKSQHDAISSEIEAAIKRVMDSGQFVGGTEVRNFENSFSQLYTQQHCIGTANGTDSLLLILKALGIGPGDEVITPAFSCFPTAEVVTLAGARIVFCDVHESYYTIDPEKVVKAITPNTRAIIAVHLFGQAAQVDLLRSICHEKGIYLIEDCAQSHLTTLNGQLVGTFGVATAFSFYPTKNLGAMGDAGCVITSDARLAERIRRLANHGALERNDHELEGMNSRLDSMQASILSVKLEHLREWNESRRTNAGLYKTLLKNVEEIQLPVEIENSRHTYHIFAIRSKARDRLKQYLYDRGISTMIHYPQAIPNTVAYQNIGIGSDDFPISNLLQQEILSLPIYPGLASAEIEYVSDMIKSYF